MNILTKKIRKNTAEECIYCALNDKHSKLVGGCKEKNLKGLNSKLALKIIARKYGEKREIFYTETVNNETVFVFKMDKKKYRVVLADETKYYWETASYNVELEDKLVIYTIKGANFELMKKFNGINQPLSTVLAEYRQLMPAATNIREKYPIKAKAKEYSFEEVLADNIFYKNEFKAKEYTIIIDKKTHEIKWYGETKKLKHQEYTVDSALYDVKKVKLPAVDLMDYVSMLAEYLYFKDGLANHRIMSKSKHDAILQKLKELEKC